MVTNMDQLYITMASVLKRLRGYSLCIIFKQNFRVRLLLKFNSHINTLVCVQPIIYLLAVRVLKTLDGCVVFLNMLKNYSL